MKAARVLLVAAGLAVMAYGVLQFSGQLSVSLLTWLLAGPPTHDLLVAPAVAMAGLLLTRLLPQPWRGAVAAASMATAVLLLLAIPLLLRPAAGPPNPGLNDRASLPGLVVLLGVAWAVLLGRAGLRAGHTRSARHHRRTGG